MANSMTRGHWEVRRGAGEPGGALCRSPPDQRQTGGSAEAAWQRAAECAERHFSKSEVSPPFPRNNALVFVSFYLFSFVPLDLAARRLFCPPSLRSPKKPLLPFLRCVCFSFSVASAAVLSSSSILSFVSLLARLPRPNCGCYRCPSFFFPPHRLSLFLLCVTKPQLHFVFPSFPSGFVTPALLLMLTLPSLPISHQSLAPLCGLQAHLPPGGPAAVGEVRKPAVSRLSDLPGWPSRLASKGAE